MTQLIGHFSYTYIWQTYISITMYIGISNLCFGGLVIVLIPLLPEIQFLGSTGSQQFIVNSQLDPEFQNFMTPSQSFLSQSIATYIELVNFLQVLFGQGDAILPYAEEICSCLKSCVHLKCKSAAHYAAKVSVIVYIRTCV